MYRTPMALAMSGGTVSAVHGRQVLHGYRLWRGAPSGGAPVPGRLARLSALSMMRDYLSVLRPLLAGERVDYDGPVATLTGGRLAIAPPPRTPVYLGALGPRMLRLAGELADGAALNWCTPEQVSWSRERIGRGRRRGGPRRVRDKGRGVHPRLRGR